MKIKILNKNNNALFDVDDGAVFTETYNETLDTGTVTISNLSSPLKMEPYDVVAIYKTGSDVVWKYMCIDTYTEMMISINPKLYRYEISLFSETKQLEGTILPNLKITKMPNITRSIFYYIDQYMTEYCPQIRVNAATTELSTLDVVVSTEVNILLGGGYTFTVTLRSSATVTDIPDLEDLRVSATVTVSQTPGGIGLITTDDDCEILYSRIEEGKWNLRFTVPLGTLNYSPYVTLNEYKVFGEGYAFTYKFNWTFLSNDTEFRDECPEMQWNTPTLREVLNDLMMVKDRIPVIRNGELAFIDLTVTQTPTNNTLSKINYVTRSRSSEDYVSELQVKLENVTDEKHNYVTKKEYITFNIPNQNATMTSNNILLRTQYPIYNLKSLKMMVATSAEGNVENPDSGLSPIVRKWDQVDLMNLHWNNTDFKLVYEYDEWITKKIAYMNNSPSSGYQSFVDYQNWTLYYTRGTNEIRNFEASQKFVWLTQFLRQILLYMIGVMNEPSGYTQYDVGLNNDAYYLDFFEVEYETLEGCVFRASKSDDLEHEKVVIDNQTNSYIDSYSQGNLEYQKANRLGNEQLQINARYLPTETELKIGDIYEDTIIYQCQYQFYRDHTEVNAIATKNYVLREYFTGVKSKIRSWKIADGSEALTRHDLKKYYCEFSYESHDETHGLEDLAQYNVVQYFLSPLNDYNGEPLTCCFVRTKDKNGTYYPSSYTMVNGGALKSYYCLDLMSRIIGNSVVFTFEFLDNHWAGQSIHTEDDFNTYNVSTYPNRPSEDVYLRYGDIYFDTTYYKITIDSNALKNGGLPTIQHKYTDNNGELVSGEVVLTGKMKNIPTRYVINLPNIAIVEDYYDDVTPGTTWHNESSNTVETQSKKFMYFAYQRPRVYESNFRWNGPTSYDYSEIAFNFNIHKDSQEITNLSTQFEFLTDTQNIAFSKYWISKQKALSTKGTNYTPLLLMRVYPKDKYNFKNINSFPSGLIDTFGVGIEYIETSNLSNEIIIKITYDGITYTSNPEAKAAAELYAKNYCFYICNYDASGYISLLALKDIPKDNCIGLNNRPCFKINLNILKTRNKNIYDRNNHYVIRKKM